jgi:23S rRNA (pseudouridine1915-N3)-methyltransferase
LKLQVLWFGRPAASPYQYQVECYRGKVNRRWPAVDLPLRPVAAGRDGDPAKVLRSEAAVVQRRLPDRWRVVALDERGDAMDSERFAGMLGDLENTGVPGLAFILGSDLGLDPGLRRSADIRLSLGPMTLPHQLARLVLWEQLFRAAQILDGGGYHRQRVQ